MFQPKKIDDSFETQRDNPGAYINKDNRALQAYKIARSKALNPVENDEINSLKEELKEIKQLLLKVLEASK